jgi:phosphoglycerate kinase
MKAQKLNQGNFEGKRVLVRCDFNVPIENGKVLDDFRILKALDTINFLIEKKAKVILISHFGDPEGKRIESLSLNPVAKRLEELLNQKVKKLNEAIGEEVEKEVFSMKEGEVLLLENIRFYPGEEECDLDFAKSLAKLGEFFVNEAFSVCHRKHASVYLLPKLLPSFFGFQLEKELENLENFLKNYQKPLVCLIGGKKIKDKAPLVKKFSEIGDWILVNHLIWEELLNSQIEIQNKEKILSPIDGVDGKKDIGEKTLEVFREKIKSAKTIFWNGPFGKIEEEKYSKGTEELAKAILESSAFSLIGGGETIEFTNKLKITEKFSFASTGGGAMLKFLAGEKLPGLEALGYYE